MHDSGYPFACPRCRKTGGDLPKKTWGTKRSGRVQEAMAMEARGVNNNKTRARTREENMSKSHKANNGKGCKGDAIH